MVNWQRYEKSNYSSPIGYGFRFMQLPVIEQDDFLEACERAYFEGQRDALDGDVRIKRNKDSCYVWTSSPWDGGEAPRFNPSFNCK